MSSYWDKPGTRRTNNSSQHHQPADSPPSEEMTISPSPGGSNATASSTGAANAVPEQFIIDPFAADINPGTTRGQKLFIEACNLLDDTKKFWASVENYQTVVRHVMRLAQKFRWGAQVVAVKLQSDLSVTKSIFTENHDLSLEDFKLQAYKIWGGGNPVDTAIPVNAVTGRQEIILTEITITESSTDDEKQVFYARVRSTMIRRAIEGHFNDKTLEVIRLQRYDFEWRDPNTGMVEENGATMLKILFDILKPSVRVGLREYKRLIQRATAQNYDNDPVEMLNAMDSAYDEITVKHGQSFDEYMEYIFDALKTFPNKIFVDFVTRLEDDYESESKSDASNKEIREVVLKVKNKYKNMHANEKWDYVDPSDAKIMALTSKLDKVQMLLKEEKDRNGPKKKDLPFDSRRCDNVGATTTIDGIDYVWCDKGHKRRALPNGMYMPVGHDHEKWEQAKQNRKKNNGSNSKAKSDPQKEMVLSDKMKTVLMAKVGFNDEDADEMIKEALN